MHKILDDIMEIKKLDKSDMLSRITKSPYYCRDAIYLAKQIKIPEKVQIPKNMTIEYNRLPQQIIIVGMGGSAIGGEILGEWLRETIHIPIEVCNHFSLPAYANQDTLVFAISYSGNTEETIKAFLDAVDKGCITIVITSGGRLLELSEKIGIPNVKIPNGLPPRVAIPYLFFPMPVLMERIGINLNLKDEVDEVLRLLEDLIKEITPEIPTINNPSKTLAVNLEGSIPIIYSFKPYGSIAHRLKTQFNENSKLPSKHEIFPELVHNEVVCWEAPTHITKQFSIILIRDQDEPPAIKHRIEITKLFAFNKVKTVLEIYARGITKLAKMFSVLYIGDFASVYLAILRNIDPTPVTVIEKIKREMGKKAKFEEYVTFNDRSY